MKILDVEGLDKSGKYTACNMLENSLARMGLHVARSEFHRYDTPTGDLIAKWLRGEWEADQLTIELVMAADKQNQQKWFQELEDSGVDILILDRYIMSQWVYSQANGVDYVFASVLQWHLRPPDHVILIDIPAEVSINRKGKHNNGENDRYERDKALLERVRNLYRENMDETDFIVDGMQNIEQIHKEIMTFVETVVLPLEPK